jgi:hypothetical protein
VSEEVLGEVAGFFRRTFLEAGALAATSTSPPP